MSRHLGWVRAVTTLLFWLSFSSPAIASQPEPGAPLEIEAIETEGLESTRPQTILDLLPRPAPARYTAAELREFRRRVKNLALFDRVEVEPVGRVLRVSVRHKATLAPVFSLSTGKTLKDSSITLGVIEHSIDNAATRLSGQVSYSERGLNFFLSRTEHPYSPNRWAMEYQVSYAGSGFRFENESSKWTRNRIGGLVEWISPIAYGSGLQLELALIPYYETSTNSTGGVSPGDGFHAGGLFEIIYDAYHWDDLVPSGYRLVLELRPGVFSGQESFRGETRFKFTSSAPLTDRTVFMANGNLAFVNTGNANHSLLLGSQKGVRGLPDALYRNAGQGFVNLELRHSIPVHRRWFVQPTLFTDAAVFNPMNALGERTKWTHALSTGVGVRVVPTGLVHTLLRVDAARLHLPYVAWLVQGGISQYF